MSEIQFERTVRLIGEEGLLRLRQSSVLLFGLGGVGGYVLEALARAGVGEFWLVDSDTVSESNRNRQILATVSTLGKLKTEAAAERVAEIQPDASVHIRSVFADDGNIPALLDEARPSYVIDAIDTVSAKLAIIAGAKERGIPVITSMGTGNHLDPARFVIGDLEKSSVCPLARVMRCQLRRRGIRGVTALWSTEAPIPPTVTPMESGRHIPASISYVPAVAGLLIGGYVIRDLLGIQSGKELGS